FCAKCLIRVNLKPRNGAGSRGTGRLSHSSPQARHRVIHPTEACGSIWGANPPGVPGRMGNYWPIRPREGASPYPEKTMAEGSVATPPSARPPSLGPRVFSPGSMEVLVAAGHRDVQLLLPVVLDQLHGALRQRHVVQLDRRVLTLGQEPVEELQHVRVLGSRVVLAHQHVGTGGDRPHVVAGLVREDQVEVRSLAEVSMGCGSLEGLHLRGHGL